MKKIIIILGMHRSGTSMVTQICQYMGAYLGEKEVLMTATKENPDGYFENMELYNINNNILHICNKEWYSLELPEFDYDSPKIIKEMEKLKDVLESLIIKKDIVALKDPRISILFPLWEQVLDTLGVEVNYIWVFRNPLEVAESLRKRDGFSRRYSLLLWMHYNFNIYKFLNGKDYQLINYKDILKGFHGIEGICQLFGKTFDDELKRELNCILKVEYCHSNYSDQKVADTGNKLLLNMYNQLLEKQKIEIDIIEYEKRYMKEIAVPEHVYMDYEAIEDIECLRKKEIIIYGAGTYGKNAAEMLHQLGFHKFNYCDKDTLKHGLSFMGGVVFSIKEIENMENLLIIIAINDKHIKKVVEQILVYIKNVRLLSYFALETTWKYHKNDYVTAISKIQVLTNWYNELIMRSQMIKNACKYPVLVYQSGKVGSMTLSKSLEKNGVENAHIHRFFFENDIVGKLILGDGQTDFIKESNAFCFQFSEYVKEIRDEMKHKKVITLVRDPISVDLSTIFQWIQVGVVDRYISEQMRNGKSFLQSISELIIKVKNRLFDWFEEELKEMYGIDVLAYPFNKKDGYTIISEESVDILIIKTEKMSQLTEIIKKFLGFTDNSQLELRNENMADCKEYGHIYKEIKNKPIFSEEYVLNYYKNNPYMDHFYSEEEQRFFWRKWEKCIERN